MSGLNNNSILAPLTLYLPRSSQLTLRLTCKFLYGYYDTSKIISIRNHRRSMLINNLSVYFKNILTNATKFELFEVFLDTLQKLNSIQKDAFLFHYLPRVMAFGDRFTHFNTYPLPPRNWGIDLGGFGSPRLGDIRQYNTIILSYEHDGVHDWGDNCYCHNGWSQLTFGGEGECAYGSYRWSGTSLRETNARTFKMELDREELIRDTGKGFEIQDIGYYSQITRKELTPEFSSINDEDLTIHLFH